MALTTPILLSVAAFDKSNAQTFRFVVQGGDQVAANRLTIKNNATLATVYDQQTTTFNLEHILPANTLTNGTYYQATITTYDSNGNASSPSTPIQFYCYTTPTFDFNNLPANNLIGNSSFNFGVTYDQAEDEMLDTYSFVLYDAQGIQILSSGTQYVGASATLPTNISYTFQGFADNTVYYIQAFGQTIERTQIQSKRERIIVRYIAPAIFSIISLTNNCDGGYITIGSKFIDIVGKSQPDPPTYVDGNTAVDVTADGSYVLFDDGYKITSDFTASLWGRSFAVGKPIISMYNETGDTLTVTLRQDYDNADKIYADLMVKVGTLRYYIYTPSIAKPASADKTQMWLRRVGGLYTLQLHDLTA